MGYEVKAQYRQAEALYDVANAPDRCIATLLHYAGPQHNRPPRRFVVLGPISLTSNFTADVCQSLSTDRRQAHPDPLFPDKTYRTTLVDYLV